MDGHSVESEKVAAVKALKCLRRGPPCEAQEDLEILITLAGREYIAKHLMVSWIIFCWMLVANNVSTFL